MPQRHAYPNSNCDCYVYSNADCDGHGHGNSNGNSDSDTYTHARADHAARAWLQSARPANGGPLLEWADLGEHRHLSQRCVDCQGAEPGWFLYRPPQPQWEGNLCV